jgi:hypothetical protein
MRANKASLGLLCALLLGAQAPAPTDSVTVTGQKEREAINAFIQSLAMPNHLTGKLARWETGICPIAVGVRQEAARFVTQRLKDVAAQVDAPLNKDPTCKPNIQIVFTTQPQALLDNIKKNHQAFLGYADNSAQRRELATFRRPIQALYLTQTVDARGKAQIDSSKTTDALEIQMPCSICKSPPYFTMRLPGATAATVTGGRMLEDGMRSTFYNVIVVADPGRLADAEMGALSDYIAMLALSHVRGLDKCQDLSSIVNLLPEGCEKPSGLTASDAGYLRGLYHMDAGQMAHGQRDFVAYQMGQAQAGH